MREDQELNEIINEATETYSLALLDAFISPLTMGVPLFSTASALWSGRKSEKQVENIKALGAYTAKSLKDLESHIDEIFIKTEEAGWLVESVIVKAKDEFRDEKRKMLSEFLANSFTKKLSGDSEKDMILDVIDRISPLHILILKVIIDDLRKTCFLKGHELAGEFQANKGLRNYFTIAYTIINQLKNYDEVTVYSSVNYMHSLGLIETPYDRGIQYSNDFEANRRQFRPTMLGLRVLDYLGFNYHVEATS